MHHHIGICVVAQSQEIVQGVKGAIDLLASSLAIESVNIQTWQPEKDVPTEQVLDHLLVQARDYLLSCQAKHQFSFHVVAYSSPEEALAALSAQQELKLDLVIGDCVCLTSRSCEALDHAFFRLFEASPGKMSPYSFMLSVDEMLPDCERLQAVDSVTLCACQDDPLIWQMQVLKNLMDHLDSLYINPMLARAMTAEPVTSSAARFIYGYMQHYFQEQWDFHYYTGSMISGFIDSMFRLCSESSVLCESGPNEHSLAVSALCGWQFYQRGYVIAVTSGMIDEFRGTLYNLKRAHAPGIILCADSPDSSWFPFQGTMHRDYDGRKSVAAKGIPYVYIDDKATMPERLEELGRKLQEQPGPVFVFATQPVLECVLKPGQLPDPMQFHRADTAPEQPDDEVMDAVMALINGDMRRILWQCSHLTEQERDLIYQIAERAGIALADTMSSPGDVSDYHQEQPVKNYIGTLSIYGFNRKVFHYLHQGQQLSGVDTQSLFFLKNKVDQAASPLSSSKLKNKCHIVQVNRRQEHMSPYTDLAVHSRLLPFLQQVLERLDVDESVLMYRRRELERVQRCPATTPVDWLPQIPMSPNYFYARLGQQLREKIDRQGFTYAGVYDVGRCGVSAIRNLPKTGKGFSGWYGRALMGDAFMSLPYLARTSSQNILAFIGDGARDLTPNIERQIEQAFSQNPNRHRIRIVVFYLCNGVLSMIRSYIDKRSATNNLKQVALMARPPALSLVREGTENIGDRPTVQVIREHWTNFEETRCEAVLNTPQSIHFIDVMLAHNSDGDGLSLLSEAAWHRINIA